MRVLTRLQEAGLEPAKIRTQRTKDGENLDIVRIGPIEEGLEENILTKTKGLGYYNARILILK